LFPTDVATYNVIIRIDQEYMIVTAKSSDLLTVTRGYASTTAAVHSAAAKVHIISQVENEGADGKATQLRARTKPANYVQTLSRTVKIAGVQEVVEKLGGVNSEMDYQVSIAMKQLALELEKTILYGVADQVGDGATTFRTMGGLWHMVATNRTSDSGSIDTTALDADVKTIWEAGGVPRAILCDGTLAQAIADLYSDRIRTDIQTVIGGVNITSIVNPLGAGPISIIPHRLMVAGEYFILDTARMGLGYVRPFFMKDLAEDGDAFRRWIGGDYTLEVMNEKAHAYRYGFS
jgi:hypothetical protein